MSQNDVRIYIILVGIFSGSLTIAAVLASKIITVFGLFVPAGVFAYCITFICTDVISEMWGKRAAQNAVLSGFIALSLAFLLIQITIHWPSAPFWSLHESFNSILGMTPRIIIASLVAYTLSQYHDVWLFHLIRRMTGSHHLWLRNNLSTAASQLLDSAVFITIAFYGILPIWPLIIGQWVIKMGIAALDTPIIYGIVWILNRRAQPTAI
jgi:queuosine precursor transporter